MPGQTPRCPKQRLSPAELRASSRTPCPVVCVFDSIVKRAAYKPTGNMRKSLATLQNPCRNLSRCARSVQDSPGYATRFFEALHSTPRRAKRRTIQVFSNTMRPQDTMPRASRPTSRGEKPFTRCEHRERRKPATDGYPGRGSGRSRASPRPSPGTPRAEARQFRPMQPPRVPCIRVRAYAYNR